MRRILSFLYLIYIGLSAQAATVSVGQAFRMAQEFCLQGSRPMARSSAPLLQSTPVYVCYRKSAAPVRSAGNSQACYYVFNIGSGNGFVVVAGDDRARGILAYSDNGAFDPSCVPASCAGWLQNYEAEIAALLDHPDATASYVVRDIDYPADVVRPLLRTTWGQGHPYNLDCPMDEKVGNGLRTVTGCTATAVAQIMYFYQYPERPSGAVRYTDTAQEVERYMNFDEEAPFDWRNMLVGYAGGVTADERQQQAVAHLMACVGHAAQMAYSSGTSIAYHKTTCEGLLKYFGYDKNMRRYERIYMSGQEWVDALTEELRAGRPVCYDGRSPAGGHTFVCDGYDGNGMYHFNWGWNGSSDGYYALSALQPGMQGIGGTGATYTLQQAMECGIQPPSSDSRPQDNQVVISYLYTMDADSNFELNGSLTVDKSDKIGLFAYCRNMGHAAYAGDLCWAVETSEGLHILGDAVGFYAPADNQNQQFRWWLDTQGLAEGEYTISIYGRIIGGDRWVKLSAVHDRCSDYLLTLTADAVSLRPKMPHAEAVVADGYVAPEVFYVGTSKDLVLPVYNSGDMCLECPVGLLLTKVDDPSFSRQVFFRILCEPGERQNVSFTLNFNNCKEGDYLLTPFYCPTAGWSGEVKPENMLPLAEPASVRLTSKPWIGVASPVGNYILNRRDGSLSVILVQPMSGNDWTGRVMARVSRDGEDTGVRLYSEKLTLPAQTPVSAVLYADADCSQLAVGDGYTVSFELDDGYGTPMADASLTVSDTALGVEQTPAAEDAFRWEVKDGQLRVQGVALRGATLWDAIGRLVSSGRADAAAPVSDLLLNVSHSGIYLLRVDTARGTEVKKIMIP